MPVDLLPNASSFAKGGSRAGALASGAATPPSSAPRLLLVPEIHPLRAASEACIRTVYDRVFGARDIVLPPVLLAWIGADGRPLCAAGVRTAADGFFSETYLNLPVERALQRRCGRPVARATVIEVTTLASRNAEASIRFVREIAQFAREAGFMWSLFTATARLRRLLNDLGIPMFVLAEADSAMRGRAGEVGQLLSTCATGLRGEGHVARGGPGSCVSCSRPSRAVPGPSATEPCSTTAVRGWTTGRWPAVSPRFPAKSTAFRPPPGGRAAWRTERRMDTGPARHLARRKDGGAAAALLPHPADRPCPARRERDAPSRHARGSSCSARPRSALHCNWRGRDRLRPARKDGCVPGDLHFGQHRHAQGHGARLPPDDVDRPRTRRRDRGERHRFLPFHPPARHSPRDGLRAPDPDARGSTRSPRACPYGRVRHGRRHGAGRRHRRAPTELPGSGSAASGALGGRTGGEPARWHRRACASSRSAAPLSRPPSPTPHGRMAFPVHEGYGLSECGSVVAFNRPGRRKPGTAGRPLPGLDVAINDGEIVVRGPSVMDRYLHGGPVDGAWRTGDLGEFDADGNLIVRGRLDNLIITPARPERQPGMDRGAADRRPARCRRAVTHLDGPHLVAALVPTARGEDWFAHAAIEEIAALVDSLLPRRARLCRAAPVRRRPRGNARAVRRAAPPGAARCLRRCPAARSAAGAKHRNE